MNIKDHWHIFALMIFAVAAGQIGRLGQKLEQGATIGGKQVIVELSMLPAFGSLGGALAAEQKWPVWLMLAVGIAAGWLGFITFRLLLVAMRTVAKQFISGSPPD